MKGPKSLNNILNNNEIGAVIESMNETMLSNGHLRSLGGTTLCLKEIAFNIYFSTQFSLGPF